MAHTTKSFFFVRHGQTDANLQGLMCGAGWDIGLNETGINQAKEAARLLRQNLETVGAICASPMIRAQKTAHWIAECFAAPITCVESLREWDIGSWDRMPFEKVKGDFLGTGEPLGGESRAQFKARIAAAIEICSMHASPLVIVSHGAVWLVLQQLLDIIPTKVENGVPYKVALANGLWRAEKLPC
jgi:probable phosphoglycerate mutase